MKKILIDKQTGSGFFKEGVTAKYICRELALMLEGKDVEIKNIHDRCIANVTII